jgi:hypothetical protein
MEAATKQYVDAAGLDWPLLAPNGTAAAPSYSFTDDPTTGIYGVAGFPAGTVTPYFKTSSNRLIIEATSWVQIAAPTLMIGASGLDAVQLNNEATKTLRMFQNANPESNTFNMYRQRRTATDYERLQLQIVGFDSSVNTTDVARLEMQANGTDGGGNAMRLLSLVLGGESVRFVANRTERFRITEDGLLAFIDNFVDIGSPLATVSAGRPRNLYLASFLQQGPITTPANPLAGLRVYPKADNHLYALDASGLETDLMAGGLPPGGTTGQVLNKASNTDRDATWASQLTVSPTNITVGNDTVNGVIVIGGTESPQITLSPGTDPWDGDNALQIRDTNSWYTAMQLVPGGDGRHTAFRLFNTVDTGDDAEALEFYSGGVIQTRSNTANPAAALVLRAGSGGGPPTVDIRRGMGVSISAGTGGVIGLAGTVEQPVILSRDPTADMEAATKQYVDAAGLDWPLLAPNGTSAAPSYSFTSDPAIGLWFSNGLLINGADREIGIYSENLTAGIEGQIQLDSYQSDSYLRAANLTEIIGRGVGVRLRAGNGATEGWAIVLGGHLQPLGNDAIDIGTSATTGVGAYRPRNVYVATSVAIVGSSQPGYALTASGPISAFGGVFNSGTSPAFGAATGIQIFSFSNNGYVRMYDSAAGQQTGSLYLNAASLVRMAAFGGGLEFATGIGTTTATTRWRITGGTGVSMPGSFVPASDNAVDIGTGDATPLRPRHLYLSGTATLGRDPTANMEAATKQYVDANAGVDNAVRTYLQQVFGDIDPGGPPAPTTP